MGDARKRERGVSCLLAQLNVLVRFTGVAFAAFVPQHETDALRYFLPVQSSSCRVPTLLHLAIYQTSREISRLGMRIEQSSSLESESIDAAAAECEREPFTPALLGRSAALFVCSNSTNEPTNKCCEAQQHLETAHRPSWIHHQFTRLETPAEWASYN